MTYKGRLVYIDERGKEHHLVPVIDVKDINAVPMTAQGFRDLFSMGAVVLTEQHYGSEFPANPVKGQLFFKKV